MRIGVIGGLGPLATAKFMEMLARRFAEHHEAVELAVINDPKTPDRTSYILDNTKENPVESILAMVDKLSALGCGLLVACLGGKFFCLGFLGFCCGLRFFLGGLVFCFCLG